MDSTTVAAAPTSPPTAPAAETADWSWLDSFGDESASAPVPPGWQVMDVGVLRFAVPNGWVAPISRSCLQPETPGVVLLEFLTPLTTCSPDVALPDSRLVINIAEGEPPSTAPNAHVGHFQAWPVSNASIETYRLTNGTEVSIGGPDAALILASFTDSGAHRVLQHGPVVATTDWKTITIDDVSMLVPPSWDVIDLSHQDFIANHGGFPNPDTCNDAWFYPGFPRAFIGDTDMTPSCAPMLQLPITPTNGVWAHDFTADAAELGPVVAQGTTNRLDITVVERTLPDNDTTSPIVDLIVRTSSHVVRVSVGVGLDASIARTILHSLHAS